MRKFDKKMQALQWPAHFFCYVTVKLPGMASAASSFSDEDHAAGRGSGRLPKQCAVCRQIFCMPCLAVLCKEKDENPSTIMKNV